MHESVVEKDVAWGAWIFRAPRPPISSARSLPEWCVIVAVYDTRSWHALCVMCLIFLIIPRYSWAWISWSTWPDYPSRVVGSDELGLD
jgi:hypothetical protein